MISMYCRAHHSEKGALCEECIFLSVYAGKRLTSCIFGDDKPVCKHCAVHCYAPAKREKIREMMRWAGSKMIFRKPFYAFVHIIDGFTAVKPIKKPLKQTFIKP